MGREEHKRNRMSRSSSRDRKTSKKIRSEHGKRRSLSKERLKKKSHSGDRRRSRSRSRERTRQADSAPPTEEKKRKQKELLKMLETPQEKLARRLAKKERKDKSRRTQMGWDAEYLGYTNADNPFGDDHLLNTFVWSKKLEKEGKKDIGDAELEKHQRKKMVESKIELEKVKKRRLEREREWDEREREREFMQRSKESEYFREWEEQEDTFHLQQAKLRSRIRIADGRAKPIDLLAQYISAEDDELAIEMHEPYTYLNGLTLTDLEDLLEDITVYTEMEQGRNADYWRDITIITEDECEKLRKLDQTSRENVGERRSGINPSVVSDVGDIFKGKTLAQLKKLQESIQAKLDGGEGVDVGYWESLLQQLKVHMAKTRLREMHEQQLRRKLFKLKQEQCIEPSAPLFPIVKPKTEMVEAAASGSHTPLVADDDTGDVAMATAEPGPSGEADKVMEESEEEKDEDMDEELITEEDLCHTDYESGRYSPVLLQSGDLEPDAIIYDPQEDIGRLDFARAQVKRTGQAKKDSDDELVKKARDGMTDDEAQFSVEMPLQKQVLLWSDKYRPRKPRFFNRVHTGFEWNKYNQTHYDIDNPPPKIVQGYKFNIFFPDLIDKLKAPEYTLVMVLEEPYTQVVDYTPLEDDKDFASLRFCAGPPYEDIAFKVVNREWEYSYKRGFRCQFQNNIFQLWFHFKRYRYRR